MIPFEPINNYSNTKESDGLVRVPPPYYACSCRHGRHTLLPSGMYQALGHSDVISQGRWTLCKGRYVTLPPEAGTQGYGFPDNTMKCGLKTGGPMSAARLCFCSDIASDSASFEGQAGRGYWSIILTTFPLGRDETSPHSSQRPSRVCNSCSQGQHLDTGDHILLSLPWLCWTALSFPF